MFVFIVQTFCGALNTCVTVFRLVFSPVVCQAEIELFQVVDAERDIEQARSGGSLVYQTITGLQPQDTVEDESASSSSSEVGSNFVDSSRPRDESPESKKVSLSSPHSCSEDMNPTFLENVTSQRIRVTLRLVYYYGDSYIYIGLLHENMDAIKNSTEIVL